MIDWKTFSPIIPGNPRVKELASYTARTYQVYKLYTPPKGICLWCFTKPVKTYRHTYCSEECRVSCWMFCYPQGDYTRAWLLAQQGGDCAICQRSFYRIRNLRELPDRCLIKTVEPGEIDHVIEIRHGGTSLGWDNLQLLCPTCHRRKTAINSRKQS